MPTHFLLKLPVSFLIIFHNLVSVILLSTAALGEDDHQYTECSGYYDCGRLKNISYPFWAANGRPQHCGRKDYELTCREDEFPVMKIKDQDFLVLNFSRQFYTMTIARSDLWDTPCTDHIVNTTLDYDRFSFVPAVRNLTLLYGCQPGNTSVPNGFTCKVKGTGRDDISYYVDDPISRIRMGNWTSCYLNFRVPIMCEGVEVMLDTPDKLKQALKQGFQVWYQAEWDLCRRCMLSNGTCGSNSTSNFVCYCRDGTRDPTCSRPGGNGKGKPIKLIVSLTVVCFIGVLGAIVFGLRRMRAKQKEIKLTTEHTKLTRDTLQEYIGGKHHELLVYDFESILVATDNFSTENKLGQGGFGPVYKGKLAEGKEIAVKRLSSTSRQGVVEFKNEMLLISKLKHKNLVRIMGCCVKEDEKLLVYEFMPNKSLDTFLFDSTRRAVLDWGTRFNIIQGVARGLVYLHHSSYLKVIHRDLKVSNILLDEKMNPKISDFGLARVVEATQNLENTQKVVGTRGYISPEYAMGRIFSQKSDVYSFGVLVLETISSKKNTAFYIYDRQLGLLAYAWQLWKEGRELELVDEMLAADSYSAPEVMKCVHIGLLCVQDNPTDRPSMLDVIFMLNGSTNVIGGPQPKQPLFTVQYSVSHPQPQPSNNEATMTMIEGR